MSPATSAVHVPVLRVPEDPGARLAFSDRASGNMSLIVGHGDPVTARARLAGAVGLDGADAVFMEQAHHAGVAVVGREDRGRGLHHHDAAVPGVDALVTRDVDVLLMVLVADCVPVLLVDPGRAVAAVHAGRRGVAAGVVPACVEVLTDQPGRAAAVIGPAIGGCCYEVPDDLADAVAGALPTARSRTRWGTTGLDLPTAVEHQLATAGVSSVRRVGACTRCNRDRWFSHRGDRSGPQGRQAGAVCRRSRGTPTGSASRLPGLGRGRA